MHNINWTGAQVSSRAGFRILLFACLFLPILGPESVAASTQFQEANDLSSRSFEATIAGLLEGNVVSSMECSQVTGGDTRVKLNKSRTKLTVEVIDNEYEAKLGRLPPKEQYEIDVHNRVASTKQAPFMPKPDARGRITSAAGLTCSPQAFPEGYWAITGLRSRDDKYGPYSIQTNAIGCVDVFMQGSAEGQLTYIGSYADTGYSIHSNTNPFTSSLSYGCLIVRQEDVARLAQTLIRDKEEDPKAKQTIRIGGY
ncbi:MAG: hypothetical protein LLF89_00060 [Spirochaetaceae bacterium]|nr:hypothetical protein [Spirochaetaceae bacterium]